MGDILSKFKLMPMRPDVVLENWQMFKPGFAALSNHSMGDYSMTTVFDDIWTGKTIFLVGMMGNEYAGFVNIRVDKYLDARSFVTIIHLYIKPGMSPEVFMEGMKFIEEFARKQGCKALRFFTLRDGAFMRRLKPLGWKAEYVQLTKEVA